MNVLKGLWADKFRRVLIISLLLLGAFLFVSDGERAEITGASTVHFFYSPTCPHCSEQKPFNEELKERYPDVQFEYHDITQAKEAALLRNFAREHDISPSQLAVPMTFYEEWYTIGFDSPETTGQDIIRALEGEAAETDAHARETVDLPMIGEIQIADYSLFALAAILGLLDGFNPCAMWALVFLISLAVGLNDKRKLWLLVGSFVFASGVLYFLFMTAWLNVFLLIGFMRPVTILVGLVAIGVAIDDLHKFFRKVALTCPVPSKQKRSLAERMNKLIHSPLTWATFFGIVVLAFFINAIEFVCSAFIPAVFTQTLALHSLSTWQYYGYILLYDVFFMLDDLIIFSMAAFAISWAGDRYAKWCKLIAGVVLLVLGCILLFAPHLLR